MRVFCNDKHYLLVMILCHRDMQYDGITHNGYKLYKQFKQKITRMLDSNIRSKLTRGITNWVIV